MSRSTAPVLGLVVAAAIAGAVWYLRRPAAPARLDPSRPDPAQPEAAPAGTAPVGSPAATASAPSAAPPPGRITRLSPAERQQLAARIATAQARRAASADADADASVGPSTDPSTALVSTRAVDALDEVATFVGACFDEHGPPASPTPLRVTARLQLSGDPDLGTLLDAQPVQAGDGGEPLPAAFDDCVRDTLQSLQLPPLAEGSALLINYTFVFGGAPTGVTEGSAR